MTLRAAIDRTGTPCPPLVWPKEASWLGQAEVSAEEVGEWVDHEGGVAPIHKRPEADRGVAGACCC
jgi:hypothetical protein